MKEKDLEKIMKAFANRRRLGILKFIKTNKKAPVGEIASAMKLSFRATSKHLGILAQADILDKEQRSLQVFYRVTDQPTAEIKALLALV